MDRERLEAPESKSRPPAIHVNNGLDHGHLKGLCNTFLSFSLSLKDIQTVINEHIQYLSQKLLIYAHQST